MSDYLLIIIKYIYVLSTGTYLTNIIIIYDDIIYDDMIYDDIVYDDIIYDDMI